MLKELQIVFPSSVLISININRSTGSGVRLGVDAVNLGPDRFVLRNYFTCFKMLELSFPTAIRAETN